MHQIVLKLDSSLCNTIWHWSKYGFRKSESERFVQWREECMFNIKMKLCDSNGWLNIVIFVAFEYSIQMAQFFLRHHQVFRTNVAYLGKSLQDLSENNFFTTNIIMITVIA